MEGFFLFTSVLFLAIAFILWMELTAKNKELDNLKLAIFFLNKSIHFVKEYPTSEGLVGTFDDIDNFKQASKAVGQAALDGEDILKRRKYEEEKKFKDLSNRKKK